MSHVATISLEIKNLDDLEAACNRLGLELVRGKESYRWFGRSVGDHPLPEGFTVDDLGKCDHAIRIPQSVTGADRAYEIGVVKRRDGKPGWTLLWDFWNGGKSHFATGNDYDDRSERTDFTINNGPGLESIVGANASKLKQAYGIAAATRAARAKGFRVAERKQSNGSVQLVLSK